MAKLNKTLLALRFQEITDCSETKAQEKINLYCCLVAHQILKNANMDTHSGLAYISLEQMDRRLGNVEVNGRRYSVWHTIQRHIPERLVTPVSVGSNLTQKLSLMKLNYDMEDIIIASGNGAELVQHLYAPYAEDILADNYDVVAMDMRSLQAYVHSNQLHEERSKERPNMELLDQLDRNLKYARKLQLIGDWQDGLLHQVRSPSPFGRTYYRGPNLQNAPKIVRHAALGDCHEYDIESSVYAWKMSLIDEIIRRDGNKISRPATLEYLDYKKAIRRRLARLIFNSDSDYFVDIIKEAITAIGFGATRTQSYVKDNQWRRPALSTIIKKPEFLTKFMLDPWVTAFVTEQTAMNNFIIAHCELQGCREAWRSIPGLFSDNGAILKNSVISYLYQQAESQLMEYVQEIVADKEVVLMVHDCVYTRRPVNLMELRAGIKEAGQYFNIEHTAIRSYGYDLELTEHRQRIAEEEKLAAEIYGTHTLPGRVARPAVSKNGDSQPYDGSGFDGSGYENYRVEDDPMFDDMDPEEVAEYRSARTAVMNPQADTLKQLLDKRTI